MRSWRKLHYKICPEFLLNIQRWQEDWDMMLASTHKKYIILKIVNNIVDHLSCNWLAMVSFICFNAMELTDDQNSKSPPQTAITIPQHWRVLCSAAANWKYMHSRYRFTSIVNPDEQKKLIDIWMSTQAASNYQQKLNLVLTYETSCLCSAFRT